MVNTSILDPHHLHACLDSVCSVFECGYGMGQLVSLLEPGETIGGVTIPQNKIGLARSARLHSTVCS